jgi:hypothetical protein
VQASTLEQAPVTIETWKAIAQYVSAATGRSFSSEAARAASKRAHDPLPLAPAFNGRVAAHRTDLDAWIARQAGRRRGDSGMTHHGTAHTVFPAFTPSTSTRTGMT